MNRNIFLKLSADPNLHERVNRFETGIESINLENYVETRRVHAILFSLSSKRRVELKNYYELVRSSSAKDQLTWNRADKIVGILESVLEN